MRRRLQRPGGPSGSRGFGAYFCRLGVLACDWAPSAAAPSTLAEPGLHGIRPASGEWATKSPRWPACPREARLM